MKVCVSVCVVVVGGRVKIPPQSEKGVFIKNGSRARAYTRSNYSQSA